MGLTFWRRLAVLNAGRLYAVAGGYLYRDRYRVNCNGLGGRSQRNLTTRIVRGSISYSLLSIDYISPLTLALTKLHLAPSSSAAILVRAAPPPLHPPSPFHSSLRLPGFCGEAIWHAYWLCTGHNSMQCARPIQETYQDSDIGRPTYNTLTYLTPTHRAHCTLHT